jgi:hypothetical protein
MGLAREPIEIVIEHLVLEGLPPGTEHRLAESLRAELARLVAARGLPGTLGDVPCRVADPVRAPRGASPRDLGHRVARSVYGALGTPKGGKT